MAHHTTMEENSMTKEQAQSQLDGANEALSMAEKNYAVSSKGYAEALAGEAEAFAQVRAGCAPSDRLNHFRAMAVLHGYDVDSRRDARQLAVCKAAVKLATDELEAAEETPAPAAAEPAPSEQAGQAEPPAAEAAQEDPPSAQ